MVISKILATLRDKRQMTFHSIVAIHIDYANREESEAEANYVEEWCSQLNILFRKRVINEVTRGITDRNEYEKVSRDIRYASYHEVLRETHGFTGEETHAAYAILFGHHVGDVQENVISNIMRYE